MKFIPYVCCGDPNLDFTYKLVKTLAPYSHIIELGIPFSDPIADGKTIQEAANRALKNKVNAESVFTMVEKLRNEGIGTTFVFMTYYNIVYAYGTEKFLEKMAKTEVQGIIIPDLPFGEDLEFEKLAKKHGIVIINLIAPNTIDERAKKILEEEKMFTYLVSSAGTTGAKTSTSRESIEFVRKVRRIAGLSKKLCVGFGISSSEQAKEFVDAGADGIIVGSRIIDIYSEYVNGIEINSTKAVEAVEKFARQITAI